MPVKKLAVIQAAPVYLDRKATIAKACDLIADAGRRGAKLILLPEVFVPAYPDWVWRLPPAKNDVLTELYARLLSESVDVPSCDTEALGEAARSADSWVVIGVNERNAEASGGSLYNTLLFFAPDGSLAGKHRKFVPTAPERMVWAAGDGSTFGTYDTPLGRMGALTCWENYMPLARYALYAWGVQIYLAPTYDEGEPWLSTLRHIAKEGRVIVAGCCMAYRTEDIPEGLPHRDLYEAGEWISEGDSAIVDPDGTVIEGPLNSEEGILVAEADPAAIDGSRWKLDVAGHYARPDVFRLSVNQAPNPMIRTGQREPAGDDVDEE